MLWWVAGGDCYEESKRDWISCCPAFVQRGSGPSGGLGVFAFAFLERSLFDIAWPQQFLGGASLVWWVAGGEWYEESKRDWIICCPAFVQRGSGPSGGLGVFAFAVLERSLFDIAWSQQFLGGASLLWWVAGGHTAQVRQTCSTAIGRRPAISNKFFFLGRAELDWCGSGCVGCVSVCGRRDPLKT